MIDLLAHAAVFYAAQFQWPEFPTNGKRAFLAGGYKAASADVHVVRGYWRDYPHSNIAVATGVPYWVLDVDPRHGGDAALVELERVHGVLPDTVRSLTPSGGGHVYFQSDARITTARGQLPAGLDVRGFGGYVVVPPSSGPDPRSAYRWEVGFGPDEISLAAAPDWLIALIVQPTSHAEDDDEDSRITPGGRHEFLLRQGGKLAWLGLSDAAIEVELAELNRTRCDPPLPKDGEAGWYRLLGTIRGYAKKGRQARRAEAKARQATADDPAEDRTDTGPDVTMDEATWPDPLPLEVRPVPCFPVDALPPVLAHVVEDVAKVAQVPPDMPGTLALGAVAGMCARRVDVFVGRTYIESLNLFCAIVAASGDRKGPTLRAILRPVYSLEYRLRQEAEPAVRRALEARQVQLRELEQLRARAARAKTDEERERWSQRAMDVAEQLLPVPVRPTLVVSDRTVEKLEVDLAQQNGALMLASEEAGTLFAIAGGRYSRDGGSQLDTYLKGYDRGEIDTGRITREVVRCATPELTILVTPQPYLLQQLRERPEFHHRGLLPRFLFAVPPSPVGTRKYDAAAVSALQHASYAALIQHLHERHPRCAGGDDLPHLHIMGEALTRWTAYFNRVEGDLREGERLEAVREWGSKQPGRVARLAGILHMATYERAEPWMISAETMEAAITLGEYFETHALVAYDLLAALPVLQGARAIVAWARRTRVSQFSARDVQRALCARFPTQATLKPCLEVLIEYGYLRAQPRPITGQLGGRPPSPTYVLHPRSRTPGSTP